MTLNADGSKKETYQHKTFNSFINSLKLTLNESIIMFIKILGHLKSIKITEKKKLKKN